MTGQAAEAIMPCGSSAGRRAARDSGTRARTVIRPNATMGTLSRNTQPHHSRDSIQPPSTGPAGRPRKLAAS